jgi:hypothetical protein
MGRAGGASEFDAIGKPAQPQGMHAQQAADFGAFGLVALAACESFQTCRRTVLGVSRFVPNNFRTEVLEKVHKGVDIGVHRSAYRDAAAVVFCKIFSGIFPRKTFPRVKKIFCKKTEGQRLRN